VGQDTRTIGGKQRVRGKVLVVDDEATARRTLSLVLEEDFDVECASNAAVAETLLGRMRVDVLLSDWQMPGMSGLELFRRVVAKHPNVVCILLTGHVTAGEVRAADRDHQIFAVIEKPYDPAELIKQLHRAHSAAQLRTISSRRGTHPPKSA
jgi:two-component system, NtrC family, response regulator HupR/HoxA